MEELMKKLESEAGLTPDQAKKSLTLISAYLKERTPGVFHSRLDQLFEGKTLEDSFRDDLNTFGKTVREKADDLADDLKTAFEKAFKSKKPS